MLDISANCIAILHGAWVLTVVSGPIISWKIHQFRVIHLGMMILTILLILSGNLCPLTTLENKLRPSDDQMYEGSFITTYLDKLFGIQIDPAWVFYGLVGWFLIWGITYSFIWRQNPR